MNYGEEEPRPFSPPTRTSTSSSASETLTTDEQLIGQNDWFQHLPDDLLACDTHLLGLPILLIHDPTTSAVDPDYLT